MKQDSCLGVGLAIVFNQILLVWSAPTFSIGSIKFGDDKVFDNEYEHVNSKVYNVLTSVTVKKGKCTKEVRVSGNGVGDTFESPCTANGVVSSTSEKMLLYGNPKENSLSLFSNEPSTLIVIQDEKCTKRMYKTVTGTTFADEAELTENECKKMKDKIFEMEDQESKYLERLDKQVDEKLSKIHTLINNAARSLHKRESVLSSSISFKPAGKHNQMAEEAQIQSSDSTRESDNHVMADGENVEVTQHTSDSSSQDPQKGQSFVGSKFHKLKSQVTNHVSVSKDGLRLDFFPVP